MSRPVSWLVQGIAVSVTLIACQHASAPSSDDGTLHRGVVGAPDRDGGTSTSDLDTARAALTSEASAESGVLADFSVGPYPSAFTLLINGIVANAAALDTRTNYGHAPGQAYLVLAIARLLSAARTTGLPGGEEQRDMLVRTALDELDQLRAASTRVIGGSPGFGLETAWDAFGDGSVNPAYTNYAWQTGLVALATAELIGYLEASGPRHASVSARASVARTFLRDIARPYLTRFTVVSPTQGYFWYSFAPSDAKAVHNTSALLAIALHRYGGASGDSAARAPLARVCELLRTRMPSTARGGYRWNYADDGIPVASRSPEDISHATNTLQLLRYCIDQGALSAALSPGVSRTLVEQIWTGNPARLNAFVDGSTSAAAWDYSRTAVIGFAAHADAAGGNPALFDYARSILVSSYLTRFSIPLSGRPYATQLLALATLFQRRPARYAADGRWSRVAGPGDTLLDSSGGVRFYYADWASPVARTEGGLTLVARADTAPFSNVLVDLPASVTGRVALSLTYSAASDGQIQLWNGAAYGTVGALPATVDETGVRRWYRTTVTFDTTGAFDYEPAVSLRNVLLQFTNRVAVHRIEATPF